MNPRQFQAFPDFPEEFPQYRLGLRITIIAPSLLGAAASGG